MLSDLTLQPRSPGNQIQAHFAHLSWKGTGQLGGGDKGTVSAQPGEGRGGCVSGELSHQQQRTSTKHRLCLLPVAMSQIGTNRAT